LLEGRECREGDREQSPESWRCAPDQSRADASAVNL
jgi:hypothetical protein